MVKLLETTDIRERISPRLRRDLESMRLELVEMQGEDDRAFAARLISYARALQDSGHYRAWRRHDGDAWAVYRAIPFLAKRLDPDLVLRMLEIPLRSEPLGFAWIKDEPGNPVQDAVVVAVIEKLIRSAYYHAADQGCYDRPADRAAWVLDVYRGRGCPVSQAANRLGLVSYDIRLEGQGQADLPGYYLLMEYADVDDPLRYAEDVAILDRAFMPIKAIAEGLIDPEGDSHAAKLAREVSWTRRFGKGEALALSIQDYRGRVLRRETLRRM